jgi:hypothetical protein
VLGVSITAHTAATVFRLNRDAFLTAVLGHAPTHRHAAGIAEARLATGGAPPAAGAAGAEPEESG